MTRKDKIMAETAVKDREWRLGEDLALDDALLDGVDFRELIDTLHANCPVITAEDVHRELERILDIRLQDMRYLLANNIDAIIEIARKGRDPE